MADAEVEAARVLLARLGVSPEQLLGAPAQSRPVPTIADYLDRVAGVVPAGTRRVYETYWRRIVEVWGGRLIDEPTSLEISQLAEEVKREAVVRKNSRGGRTAAEHLISALRCLYRYATIDGLISEQQNPAIRVPKPRRLATTRRALPPDRLAEINSVAATTGNDPELDAIILRLHTETACRRGGALALNRDDLDIEQSLVRLREKGETMRWQPVSPSLTNNLLAMTEERGARSAGPVLRYHDGRSISARRYDYLWQRLGKYLPWVAAQQVSTHWIRHTTLTWVERNFGYAVARAYAGHSGKNDAGVTATYVRADLHEVAAALSAMTGEPHPLALRLNEGNLTQQNTNIVTAEGPEIRIKPVGTGRVFSGDGSR